MTERVELGKKTMIVSINPDAISYEDGPRLAIEGEEHKTVLHLTPEMVEAIPAHTHCAEIKGDLVADIWIGEDCFPKYDEHLFVSAISEVTPAAEMSLD